MSCLLLGRSEALSRAPTPLYILNCMTLLPRVSCSLRSYLLYAIAVQGVMC